MIKVKFQYPSIDHEVDGKSYSHEVRIDILPASGDWYTIWNTESEKWHDLLVERREFSESQGYVGEPKIIIHCFLKGVRGGKPRE